MISMVGTSMVLGEFGDITRNLTVNGRDPWGPLENGLTSGWGVRNDSAAGGASGCNHPNKVRQYVAKVVEVTPNNPTW